MKKFLLMAVCLLMLLSTSNAQSSEYQEKSLLGISYTEINGLNVFGVDVTSNYCESINSRIGFGMSIGHANHENYSSVHLTATTLHFVKIGINYSSYQCSVYDKHNDKNREDLGFIVGLQLPLFKNWSVSPTYNSTYENIVFTLSYAL